MSSRHLCSKFLRCTKNAQDTFLGLCITATGLLMKPSLLTFLLKTCEFFFLVMCSISKDTNERKIINNTVVWCDPVIIQNEADYYFVLYSSCTPSICQWVHYFWKNEWHIHPFIVVLWNDHKYKLSVMLQKLETAVVLQASLSLSCCE